MTQRSEDSTTFAGDDALLDTSSLTLAREYVNRRHTIRDMTALVRWREEFFRWTEARGYEVISYETIRNDLWLVLEKIRCWIGQRGKRTIGTLRPTKSMIAGVMDAVTALCAIDAETAPAWLDKHRPNPRRIIAFTNGILDVTEYLKNGMTVLIPPTPRLFSLNTLVFAFERQAKCPNFMKFLTEVLSDDPERIALAQEWWGLNLVYDTSFQKLLFLVGPPGSGKGTFCRALRHCVGPHNCASPTLDSLSTQFGLHGMVNKTAAVIPDAHIGKHTEATGVLNTILAITGEDCIDVHRKHLGALQNIRLGARFTIGVNRMPQLPDASNAILRRLLAMPFSVNFQGREDRTLEAKLCAEAPGIVIWALEGLRRLEKSGRFTTVAAASRLVNEFKRQNSKMQAFIDDCLVLSGDNTVQCKVDDLFSRWSRWCSDNGVEAGSKPTFGTALSAAMTQWFDRQRLGPRGFREWHYVGIGLRHEHADDDDDGASGGELLPGFP